MKKTLLLTPWMEPKDIIHWQDAIKLKYEGNAEVLVEYENEDICSPSTNWKQPAVMRLKRMPYKKRRVRYSREAVYRRDNYTCGFCGKAKRRSELTRDHVHPQSRGGKTDFLNTISACRDCNSKKRDRTPEEAKMPLLWQPTKPKFMEVINPLVAEDSIPVEWIPFAGLTPNV